MGFFLQTGGFCQVAKKRARNNEVTVLTASRVLNKCVTKMTKLYPSHPENFFRVSI